MIERGGIQLASTEEPQLEEYTPVERLEVRAESTPRSLIEQPTRVMAGDIIEFPKPHRKRNSDKSIDDGSDGIGMKGGSVRGVVEFISTIVIGAVAIGMLTGFFSFLGFGMGVLVFGVYAFFRIRSLFRD